MFDLILTVLCLLHTSELPLDVSDMTRDLRAAYFACIPVSIYRISAKTDFLAPLR